MGNPVRHSVGLARAGSGNNEQRCGQVASSTADTVIDGPPLLDIQFGEGVERHL